MTNTGIRIVKDSYVDYSSQSSREKIPTASVSGSSISFPVKGSLAYDTITDSIWFGNGSDWAPVGGGGGGVTQITVIESTGMPPGTFGIIATPNPITGVGTIALADILTVTPGAYTNANITVDQQGRLTFAENGSGGGTVTQITAVESTGMPPGTFGIECTPNPITGVGTIALADILTVTPGDYTNANITVDQQGRITVAANGGPGIGDKEFQTTTLTSPVASMSVGGFPSAETVLDVIASISYTTIPINSFFVQSVLTFHNAFMKFPVVTPGDGLTIDINIPAACNLVTFVPPNPGDTTVLQQSYVILSGYDGAGVLFNTFARVNILAGNTLHIEVNTFPATVVPNTDADSLVLYTFTISYITEI